MKVAIFSDVHGNLPAFEAVLADMREQGVDQMISLGDLSGYYCFVNEVIDRIRELKITTLCGNHDRALTREGGKIARSKTCTRILARQLTEITDMNFRFLDQLEPRLKMSLLGKEFVLVHGGLVDPVDEYLDFVSPAYLEENGFSGDFLIYGHTHLARYYNAGRTSCLNPGSVGQPRDFDPRASYALLTRNALSIRRVEYDVELMIKEMKQRGYEDYISEGLRTGKKIGA